MNSSDTQTPAPKRSAWPGLLVAALLGALLYAATGPRREPPNPVEQAMVGLDAGERAAYLEAVSLATRPGGSRDLGRALELLEPLAARNPPHAPALAHWADVKLRLEPRAPAGPIRDRLASALRHDPDNAMVYRVLGDYALYRTGRWRDAALAYDTALAIDPEDTAARVARARLRAMHAQFDGAIADLREAVKRHPSSVALASDLGWFYSLAGRNSDALDACRVVQRLQPTGREAPRCFLDVHLQRGDALAAQPHALALMRASGAPATALARVATASPAAALVEFHHWEIDTLTVQARDGRGRAVWLALAHAHLGQWPYALDWLERAHERGERELRFAAVIPAFQPLHSDPRFQRLLNELNLPPPSSIALPRVAGQEFLGCVHQEFSVIS